MSPVAFKAHVPGASLCRVRDRALPPLQPLAGRHRALPARDAAARLPRPSRARGGRPSVVAHTQRQGQGALWVNNDNVCRVGTPLAR